MLPENPEREIAQFQQVLMIAFEALTNPSVMAKVQQEGNTFNISPLIQQILIRQKINNPDVFRRIKPEESEGFVSVKQMREAQQNISASIQGQPPPFPPKPDDDHRAKIETYASAQLLLQLGGQVSDAITQLIQIHQALLQDIQSKEAAPGQQVNLSKPKFSIGRF